MPNSLYPLIEAAVNASGFPVTEVVCGMAKGADSLGMAWAVANKVPVAKFPADWTSYGRAAGPIRNREMLNYADALIVLMWDGSKGAANMLTQTVKAGKAAFVVLNGDLSTAYKT